MPRSACTAPHASPHAREADRGRPGTGVAGGPRRVLAAVVATLVGILTALALAAPAPASTSGILRDFRADGRIDPCAWSAAQLQGARRAARGDTQAYSPDFLEAIDDALAGRSGCGRGGPSGAGAGAGGGGGASGGGTAGGGAGAGLGGAGVGGAGFGGAGLGGAGLGGPGATSGPGGGAGGAGAPTAPGPGPYAASTDDGAVLAAVREPGGGPPGWVWALILGGLVLLALAVWLVRWSGWVPRWAAPATHVIEEAGWRIGNRASEFGDWLRRGR